MDVNIPQSPAFSGGSFADEPLDERCHRGMP
jgi:hypothetical protein